MKLEKIHEDQRGMISILKEDIPFEEITIFHTNEGYARGGCIHEKNIEICYILDGEVTYIIGMDRKDMVMGESVIIPENTPHYYFSKTDSIVLEYGATAAEKAVKHPEFRKIVEDLNKDREEWERGMNG